MLPNTPSRERGLLLVYTGEGKGKTTAALGLVMRALGRGLRPLVLQFIKSPERSYGERVTLDRLGVENHQLGIGFTWTKTPEEHRRSLEAALRFTKEKVASEEYDLIVLDELNNALAITSFPIEDVFPLEEVLSIIDKRPFGQHMVITGRHAHPLIIERADLVTQMEPVKHYYDRGIPAVKGLEV
jgi:cob(I)alamin adenosyltransferase